MSFSVNTNVASIVAQQNLTQTQLSLQTAMQRLSSGMRINSAADDAAGYSIAARMTTQVGGLDQATRNANDGISLVQVAQGSLSQILQNLQGIRNLSVQAANASNSASDRTSLNNQATQMLAENNRIAASTNFNGVNLLDGSFNTQTFQVGANNTTNDSISISSISSALNSALGVGANSSYSTTVNGGPVTNAAFANGDLTINGYQVGSSAGLDTVSNTSANGSAIAKAAAINAVTSSTNVSATVNANNVGGVAATTTSAIASGDILINGVNIGAVSATTTSGAERGAQVAAAINAVSSQTGVTATFSTTNGAVALNATDGRNITVQLGASGTGDGLTGASNTTTTTLSSISLSSTSSAGITLGGATGATEGGFSTGFTSATVTVGAGVSSLNLTTAAGAQAAISTIDAAIKQVTTSAANLGALQNRFQATVSNLGVYSQNLQTSRSRIQDADFAKETANMTRSQVLSQAGTAVLAQANALPNGILALLR